jgi:hypothetical protein
MKTEPLFMDDEDYPLSRPVFVAIRGGKYDGRWSQTDIQTKSLLPSRLWRRMLPRVTRSTALSPW